MLLAEDRCTKYESEHEENKLKLEDADKCAE